MDVQLLDIIYIYIDRCTRDMVSEIYVYIYSRYIYWRYGLQMSSVKETMNFLKGMNEGVCMSCRTKPCGE